MKQINNLLKQILILIVLSSAILLNIIPISAQSANDTASNSQTTVNARDLEDCSAMLDKTLDALKACKDKADKAYNYAAELYAQGLIDKQLLSHFRAMVADYDKRIKYLEKIKCSTVSIFWVIRWKRCN